MNIQIFTTLIAALFARGGNHKCNPKFIEKCKKDILLMKIDVNVFKVNPYIYKIKNFLMEIFLMKDHNKNQFRFK